MLVREEIVKAVREAILNGNALGQIEEAIDELIGLVAGCSRYAWVHYVQSDMVAAQMNGDGNGSLTSPAAQRNYLLGLVLAHAREPETSPLTPVTQEAADRAYELLEQIFQLYSRYGIQEAAKIEDPEERAHKSLVWMQGFASGHFELDMLDSDQMQDRLDSLFKPFDDELRATVGFGVTDFQSFFDQLADQMDESVFKGFRMIADAFERHQAGESMEDLQREGPEASQALQDSARIDLEAAMVGLDEGVRSALKASLIARFDDPPELRYPTGASPFLERPVIELSDGTYACPLPIVFWPWAMRFFPSACRQDGKLEKRFFKARGDKVEVQIDGALESLGVARENIVRSAFLKQDSTEEHDRILIVGRTVVSLEAKSRIFRPPRLNIEVAAQLISDDFRKKSGIQGGADQIQRLRKVVLEDGQRDLYDRKGNVIATLPDDIADVLGVVVTHDTWGAIGANPTLLLDEGETDAPVVISGYDLERFASSIVKREGGVEKLVEYLQQRRQLGARVVASDEMDVAGAFLTYDEGLLSLPPDGDDGSMMLQLEPTYSRLFDDDWREAHGGRRIHPPADPDPVVVDLDEALEEIFAERRPVPGARTKKIGRNERCPCGSGKKYKRCCGAPGRASV